MQTSCFSTKGNATYVTKLGIARTHHNKKKQKSQEQTEQRIISFTEFLQQTNCKIASLQMLYQCSFPL